MYVMFKAIGFLSNNDADPLENHKATEPEFNVGPSSSHQQNVILMANCCLSKNHILVKSLYLTTHSDYI